MDASMISHLKSLDGENRHFKKIFAELSIRNELLKDALGKNRMTISTPGDDRESCQATARQCFLWHAGPAVSMRPAITQPQIAVR